MSIGEFFLLDTFYPSLRYAYYLFHLGQCPAARFATSDTWVAGPPHALIAPAARPKHC